MAVVTTPADTLRDGLRQPGLLLAWFCLGSVPLIELGVARGFDAAVIDLQHGLWDRMSTHCAVSALGGVPMIARVAANTVAAIGAALDSGAAGVLVPLVETPEQARDAVAAAYFPPRGVRSGGGVRPLGQGFASYVEGNARPLVGIMIETTRGVAEAAAIAAIPGVDLVLIGTGDLALSIGCFPTPDERLEQACQSVRAACLAAGVPCGIFTTTAEAARQRLDEGFAASVGANDIAVVVQGFKNASAAAASHTTSERVHTN